MDNLAGTVVPFGGDKGNLRLRGENENGTADLSTKGYANIEFSFSNVNVACMGDILTLLDWKNYKRVDTSKASFGALFANCTVLTSAPDLPAMTLSPNCYDSMFMGCTALVNAPDLPATTLAEACYAGMFNGCTALEKAPDLPATELAVFCYNYMFGDCSMLSTVTMSALSEQITKTYACCSNWLDNAGTNAKTRTLLLKDKTAYDALKANKDYLPDNWQIGQCTVLDEYNAKITE